MTSVRQIEANRHKAFKSTGQRLRTENTGRGVMPQARFSAETVIEPLENPEECRGFEEAIVSEYLPQTPVERELVNKPSLRHGAHDHALLHSAGWMRRILNSAKNASICNSKPVFNPQSFDAPKFTNIIADQDQTFTAGMAANEHIIGTNGFAGSLELSPKLTKMRRGLVSERKHLQSRGELLDNAQIFHRAR